MFQFSYTLSLSLKLSTLYVNLLVQSIENQTKMRSLPKDRCLRKNAIGIGIGGGIGEPSVPTPTPDTVPTPEILQTKN